MTLDHVPRNQAGWTRVAPEFAVAGRHNWGLDEPRWGVFGVPESDVGMLPDVADRDVLEVGCGTAYVSAWIARRGGRPVGLDPTTAQLDTARALQDEFDLAFPLVQAIGERLPFADASFDVAVSEYGAAIWADPYQWIPEIARVLRPGGELAFLGNSTLAMLCVPDLEAEGPATERLRRPQFGMHRFEWPDEDGVEFHISPGDWIALLTGNGFEVTHLIEVRPDPDATTRYPWIDVDWARRWPCEEVWRARKRA